MALVSQKVVVANGAAMVDLGFGDATRVPISDNDPLRATYALFLPNFVPVANPTDILEIAGSASRIVRIRSIIVTGIATSASNIILNTVRRSSLATGSTPTTQSLISRDTGDASATATVRTFQGSNPVTGTLIGNADGGRLNLAPAANGSIDRLLFQYSWLNDKAPILRGPTDTLCLNLGGAAWPAGGALDVNIVLSEDLNPQN